MSGFVAFILWSALSAAPAPAVYSPVPEANELFIQAHAYLDKSDPRVPGGKLSNAREAIKLYDAAVAKDPKFALAYVEMSRAWLRLGYSDPDGATNDEILPPARTALLKALAIDHDLIPAHLALAGLYASVDFQWKGAEDEYKLVLARDPNNVSALTGYASFLTSMGRFGEAMTNAKKADDLASSVATNVLIARIQYSMRRYDESVASGRKALTKGENVLSHFFLGFAEVALHKNDEAIAEFEIAASATNNGGASAGLAYGYAMAGRREEALAIVHDLETSTKRGLIVPYRLAAVYLALGDKDRAMEWLEKDFAERDNWMNQLKVDPVMDPLRSDPRFKKLMRQMNLD